jgi:hypothetical protein
MKTFFFLTILLYISAFTLTNAQESCKVLTPQLQDTYEGDCKNGLADGHGKATGLDVYEGNFKKGWPNGVGTYTWNTGAVYTGGWKKGMRHGVGKYTYHINDKEMVEDGLWKNDIYKGVVPAKPDIIRQINIDKVIPQYLGEGKKIEFKFFYGGSPVRDVTGSSLSMDHQLLNIKMEGSSGTEFFRSEEIGYENMDFPFTIKLTYTSYNQLQTMKIDCLLEMKFTQSGSYRIQLHNMGMQKQN